GRRRAHAHWPSVRAHVEAAARVASRVLTDRPRLGTVWRMRRLLPALALVLIAATFGLLGATSPSWAHSEHDMPLAGAAPSPHADLGSDHLVTPALSVAPNPPALPWPLLIVALLAVLVCRRRTRRVVALALVVLLAVLSFEDGLHSVHHLTEHAKP